MIAKIAIRLASIAGLALVFFVASGGRSLLKRTKKFSTLLQKDSAKHGKVS